MVRLIVDTTYTLNYYKATSRPVVSLRQTGIVQMQLINNASLPAMHRLFRLLLSRCSVLRWFTLKWH